MSTQTFECTITTPMALNETNMAQGTLRWFVHKSEYDPRPCEFRYLVNGKDAFGALYKDMLNAKHSIDIICWGFQPSMHFVRDGSKSMSVGELLVHKGEKDNVKVRLLCWHDPLLGSAEVGENNMPGYDVFMTIEKHHPILERWHPSIYSPDYQTLGEAAYDAYWYHIAKGNEVTDTVHKKTGDQVWDDVTKLDDKLRHALSGTMGLQKGGGFKNIELATRTFDTSDREEIIGRIRERGKRAGWSNKLINGMTVGMGAYPTHHQKTVLIDYEHPDLAVGYVMGHNTLDQYWDADEHHSKAASPTTGRSGPSPWQDISSRVTGPILQDINANFCQAWDEATGQKLTEARDKLGVKGKHDLCLDGSAVDRGVMAQVLRTQSQHGKTDIGKMYLQALNNATQYVFVENQYFRWDEFSDTIKKATVAQQKAGRDPGQHGPIYLFVITNSSDAAVGDGTLTTYQMLKSLGYGDRMPGVQYAEEADQLAARKASLESSLAEEQAGVRRLEAAGIDPGLVYSEQYLQDSEDRQSGMRAELDDIKKKQDELRGQEKQLKETPEQPPKKNPEQKPVAAPPDLPNLKVLICTLVAPDSPPAKDPGDKHYDWVPVYVHAKLMIIDDAFMTLGSANVNFRSMNVDSEINICLENGLIAKELREKLWGLHTSGGGSASSTGHQGMKEAYKSWTDIVNENRTRRNKKIAPKSSLVEFFRSSSDRSYKD